jgi:hypothetical protein
MACGSVPVEARGVFAGGWGEFPTIEQCHGKEHKKGGGGGTNLLGQDNPESLFRLELIQ